jgi:hypothetical protein
MYHMISHEFASAAVMLCVGSTLLCASIAAASSQQACICMTLIIDTLSKKQRSTQSCSVVCALSGVSSELISLIAIINNMCGQNSVDSANRWLLLLPVSTTMCIYSTTLYVHRASICYFYRYHCTHRLDTAGATHFSNYLKYSCRARASSFNTACRIASVISS